MYRVFLSYSTDPRDTVIVWRLQSLAAASGLHLDVPDRVQRSDWNAVQTMIMSADAVIALLTASATPQVVHEVTFALENGKKVFPVVEPGALTSSMKSVLQHYQTPAFILNPAKPWEMEQNLHNYLKSERMRKAAKTALTALVGTAVALILLQEITES